jgi:hypothetical protein
MLDEAIAATHNAIFHLQLAKDEVFILYANLHLRRGYIARSNENAETEDMYYLRAFQRLREAMHEYPNSRELRRWADSQLNTVIDQVKANNRDKFVWALWYSAKIVLGQSNERVRQFNTTFGSFSIGSTQPPPARGR